MQFEHMEVGLGATSRQQVIGPFSSGLNVIAGGRGSGKSRLVAWLRQVISENAGTPYAFHQGPLVTRGTLDLRNHGAVIRFVQSADGLRSMRGDSRPLSGRQKSAFDQLCAAASDNVDSVRALDDIAVGLGLDDRGVDGSIAQRDRLVAQEREMVVRLEQMDKLTATRDEILGRRRDIEFRLDQLRKQMGVQGQGLDASPHFRLDRYAAVDADLRGAVADVEQCDREIAEIKADLKLSEIGCQKPDVDQGYRDQLQQLEDRLNRWRQTLRDIKNHRESIEHDETDARLDEQTGMQLSGTLYPDARGSMRSLEAQLHNAKKQLDQLVSQYATGYYSSVSPLGTHGTYSTPGSLAGAATSNGQSALHGLNVQRDATGRAHIDVSPQPIPAVSHHLLPEMLRSMQRDLQDVCHHLSRQEANSAAQALKQQVQQLRRCETELLQSVEKLVEERGLLLRKIADKYHLTTDQLSLTFGDWCQCSDHEHLYEWLLKDESIHPTSRRHDSLERSKLSDTLARLQAQRKQAVLRAEECRRQLRELERGRPNIHVSAPVPSLQSEESELLRELDSVLRNHSDIELRDRLRGELEETRRQIARLPQTPISPSEYRELVNRNILGLASSLYQSHLHPTPRQPLSWSGTSATSVSRQYDTVNGIVSEHPDYRRQVEVPRAIICTAQRLAIAQALACRGDRIPVVLDQTLDGLHSDLLRSAVDYLDQAARSLQIIVLTENTHLVDLVRSHRGQVHHLNAISPGERPEEDINRVLTSLANEEEADKWYRSSGEPVERSRVRQYYLSRYSRVEDLPTIPRAVAARFRAIGIDTIGDLLDADPYRLSAELRIPRATALMVQNWQSIGILLCSVRGLRPFDARVLVGAGIRDAGQLSAVHPTQLLERVERFLTTETGHSILRSGNSYELSRITSWIASAKSGSTRSTASNNAGSRTSTERKNRNRGLTLSRPNRQRRSRSNSENVTPSGHRRPTTDLSPKTVSRRETLATRSNSANARPAHMAGSYGRTATGEGATASLRFYLELTSPIVDAPAIGPRTAERLNQQGVYSVEQLLAANQEGLARKLGHRRVTADTVRQWQDQARLVCRIPNLRGHDAQMLVACDITTPEALASMTAEVVLGHVLKFARSEAGQRVLRGSKEPDLAEVNDWIAWARQCRSLHAA